MIAKIKQDWYLYREYGRKMKHHGKLSGTFAVISVFVLLLVSVVYGTLDSYIETLQDCWQLRKLSVSDVPGEEAYSLLREKYADNPDIEDVWMNFGAMVDLIEWPVDFPDDSKIICPINSVVQNSCKQIRTQKNMKEDQMIIPKFILAGKTDRVDVTTVSGEQFLGETVTVHYAGQTKEFVIAGTYDNSELLEEGDYYISENSALEIIRALGKENYIYCEVLVKDQEQVKKYKDEIDSLIREKYTGEFGAPEPSVQIMATIETKETAVGFFYFVLSMASVLAVVALLWTGLGILLSQLKQLNLRKSEFGLLKAIGYRNRQLSGMLRMEALMFSARILLIAGVLTVVIILVYTGWVLFFVSGLYHFAFLPKFNLILLVPILLAAVGIPLAAYEFSARKMKKIVPIEALR